MRFPAKIHSEEGFTLVEVLIVLIIIGVLVGLAVPQFISQRNKATGAQARSDLRNAATVEEAQVDTSGGYTSSMTALTTAGFKRTSGLQMGVAATPDGYCEVASEGGTYWWFDSSAGGVQSDTTTRLSPPVSANGICKTSVPASLN
jgi:type IV pilus assembly protein PilA